MVFQIDLKRNPQVGDLIADLNMGDSVAFRTSLKSKNGELAEFTLEKAVETPESMKDSDEESEDDEDETEEEAVVDGDEMESHSKMPAPDGSKNTPGGSQEQDRLAASLAAQI